MSREGTLLYANRTSGPLLRMWDCEVGQRLPAEWCRRVADAYAQGRVEELEVTCDAGRVYSCILTPIAQAGYLNLYTRDVTERRQAEAALRASEARLRDQREWLRITLTSIGDAVLTADTAGRVTFLNPVAEALTGWAQAEAVGQPADRVFRIINERTQAPVEDLIARVLRDKTVIALANHTALLARNGRTISIEDSAAPITDGTDQMVGVVVVFHDVTEKRRAQETLREQAQILALAHVLIRDPESRIASWNAGAERLYGYTVAEAVGQSSHVLLQTVSAISLEEVDTALRTRGHWEGELIHTAKDGRRITVASHQVLHRDEAGIPRAILEVNNDITTSKQAEEQLRESEARFRTLADAIPQLAWIARADGWIYWYNRRWYEYTGTTPEQMEGWGWQRVHNPETLPAVLGRWQASIATGQPFDMIFPLRGADGVFRPFLTRVMPITDAQGAVLQWFGTNTDVSAQQAAADALRASEQALREARDHLEQRVKDRTAELAQKASQLQALTAELTLAEQRERQRLAEHLHDGLQQLLVAAKFRVTLLPRVDPSGIATWSQEMEHLLTDAIATSRTLTGELSPPILQTGGLVAGLEWLVRWKAERYQLAVDLQADPEAVPDSEAMTLLLFQSVRELLFNVVKHAQVQVARVEVRRQDEHLRIVVSDQGVGFDPATLTGTSSGGLGLSSIRQRLEYLGGCVDIASAPGEGCRITLAAPLRNPASAPPTSVASAPVDGRSPPGPRAGRRRACYWWTIMPWCARPWPRCSVPNRTWRWSARRPTARRGWSARRSCSRTWCSWTSTCPA